MHDYDVHEALHQNCGTHGSCVRDSAVVGLQCQYSKNEINLKILSLYTQKRKIKRMHELNENCKIHDPYVESLGSRG